MMDYENLILDQDGAVLKITVNRPEVFNAQGREIAYRLERDGDESQRVRGAQRARNRDERFGDHG